MSWIENCRKRESGRDRERVGGRESGRKMETDRERARAEEGESSRGR